MGILRVVESLEHALAALGEGTEVWVTSARAAPDRLPHADARARLRTPGPPVLLVFGTGWGLAPRLVESAHARLAPILSPRPDGYNHLSVRAAAAITLDRLLDAEPR
jgi:hypothetical protein